MRLQNERLVISFFEADERNFGRRFDRSMVIDQVTLDGDHHFCQPEQIRPGRRTCSGRGLSAEFVWDELPLMTQPGDPFPKLGVGILRQKPKGGSYDIWYPYEVLEDVSIEVTGQNGMRIARQQIACQGRCVELVRRCRIEKNHLIIDSELWNHGSMAVHLFEYQHNFVALDHLPVGPGYRLEVPFDRTAERICDAVYRLRDRTKLEGWMYAEERTICWRHPMAEASFHKVTEREEIDRKAPRRWRLYHDACPISIEESFDFIPTKLVLWGVEHCICAEVYHEIQLPPGGKDRWQRVWTFSADDG